MSRSCRPHSLRKWGLTILGTGAYLPHPCPTRCNRPAPANLLNHACLCIKTATPLFGAQSLKRQLLWARLHDKPEFSKFSERGAWFLQHFWRPQCDSLEPGGAIKLEWRNPRREEEVCHLMAFQVLFQTNVPTFRTSPNLAPWRDRPTHREWPQDHGRPQGQSPVRSYPSG